MSRLLVFVCCPIEHAKWKGRWDGRSGTNVARYARAISGRNVMTTRTRKEGKNVEMLQYCCAAWGTLLSKYFSSFSWTFVHALCTS